MKNKIILTKIFQKEAVDILKKDYDLIIVEGSGKDLKTTLKNNPDTEVIISFLSDKIDRDIIEISDNLKIISNYAVGYNNIDFIFARDSGIFVTNTPDVLTAATADLTMALILGVSRRIVESDKYMRSGKFKGWGANLLLGRELGGLTLGIIGLGKIGLATALRARAFGINIAYYSNNRKPDLEKKFDFEYMELEELIKNSDIISPHIPYSDDVHHLFNKNTFEKMKDNAIFINVSRGGIMNESHLADALESKKLFGAGLDVFEFEPRVNDRLNKLDNVIMVPHIGSATYTARLGMANIVIKNIKQVFSGKVPENLIPEHNVLKS